jgi:hypothetical protein
MLPSESGASKKKEQTRSQARLEREGPRWALLSCTELPYTGHVAGCWLAAHEIITTPPRTWASATSPNLSS